MKFRKIFFADPDEEKMDAQPFIANQASLQNIADAVSKLKSLRLKLSQL